MIDFFDTETTGLPDWKKPSGSDCQPHIVQLANIQVDSKTREETGRMDVIVKPDGWESCPEALEVHGITTEMAMDVGVPERDVLDMFLDMNQPDNLRVAFNTTFDNRIIRIAIKRYYPDFADEWKGRDYYCAMWKSKPVIGRKKTPSLAEAYKFFTGKEIEGAHNAMNDVLAMIEVYWGIQEHNAK